MVKEQEKLFEEAKKMLEREEETRKYQNAMCWEIHLEQTIRQRTQLEVKTGKITEVESYWVNKILMTPVEMLVRNW